MDEMRVTRHGDKRTRERIGVPRSAVQRLAAKAYAEGVAREDTHGGLRRYLDYVYHTGNREGNNIRVWGEKVWVFCDRYLVTVLDLPLKFKNRANAMKKNKELEKNDAE